MTPQIEINSFSELIEALRAASVISPLRASETTWSQIVEQSAIGGISFVATNLEETRSDNDFLLWINASLRELRLSDLLGNVEDKRLTHIFFVSSLAAVDESLASKILSVAHAFSGTTVRFCFLLPDEMPVTEVGVIQQLLDLSPQTLRFSRPSVSLRPMSLHQEALIKRVADLERSLKRLDKSAKALELRGKKLRQSLDGVDVAGFLESIAPSNTLQSSVRARIDQIAEESMAISINLTSHNE